MNLYKHQIEAVGNMKNGCILCGGVGSGKSRTSLAYFYEQNGGEINDIPNKAPGLMNKKPLNLYIITTARKRDTKEWEDELSYFLMTTEPSKDSVYDHKVVVDSWNNIQKYKDVKGAFFIFDEQRVVGKGAWVKAFLTITKANKWILLSATPGDTWTDYIPVFIANGFYKNRTEFNNEHVVWKPYSKFPQVQRYLNERKLLRLKNSILIDMDFKRPTVSHHENVFVDYDAEAYRNTMKNRWDYIKNEPIENASGLCYALRRVVNENDERLDVCERILEQKKKAIIFYNFDYELAMLKERFLEIGDTDEEYGIAEWNGHKHEPIPETDRWVYLVQYTAGAEGWNCIETDTTIFFSQNYSYKVLVQASGRIDRLNTPFTDLYFYHIKTRSNIDLAISRAIRSKKNFNERTFAYS